LAAAAVDDLATLGGFHSLAKAACLLPFNFTWLIGSFHKFYSNKRMLPTLGKRLKEKNGLALKIGFWLD
jgi:hypothetical protein